MLIAICAAASSDDAMLMRPSSSTSILTPVRSTIERMVLPPEPMRSRVFSTGILIVMMPSVSAILPRMCRRPWRRLFERLAHDVHRDGHSLLMSIHHEAHRHTGHRRGGLFRPGLTERLRLMAFCVSCHARSASSLPISNRRDLCG